ncbi:NAD-dependent epimerase/dehydratase family protein [Virgisporangium aurantiacum]
MVTGAAGFIGSHLVDALLATGHVVVGVDRRNPCSDLLAGLNLAGAVNHPKFTWVDADVANASLDAVLDGADCVFHLAGLPGVRRSWGCEFAAYVTANIVATERLVAACERAGVRRLVYASSSSVYGPTTAASRESDPTRPISPYGITKLAGELLCLAHAVRADSRLSVVALRYFTVYGPRQRPDMAIGRMLAAALTGKRYPLFGNGSQRREFTYVSDVVNATIAASRLEQRHAVVNVGGGASVSITDLLGIVGDLTGRPVPLAAVAAQPGDVCATAADLTNARACLDYRPSVNLPVGLALHLEWLRGLPAQVLRLYEPMFEPCAAEVASCTS